MGMFDKEVLLKNADFAKDGQTFTLHSAEYIGRVKSAEYGENDKATVEAGPDHEDFVVFGVLAQQIQRMEQNELPTQVRIGQDGRAKIFVQA